MGAVPRFVRVGRWSAGSLAMPGAHQRRNGAVAEAILAALPEIWRPRADAIRRGVARAWLPGRFDRRGRWVFDVAHNPDGFAALVETLEAEALPRPVTALVGILRDKPWQAMLERLRPSVDRLWLTTPPSAPQARRWHLDEVAPRMSGDVEVEPDFAAALRRVQRLSGTVLVTGSFHTVGDALARLPGFAPLG